MDQAKKKDIFLMVKNTEEELLEKKRALDELLLEKYITLADD